MPTSAPISGIAGIRPAATMTPTMRTFVTDFAPSTRALGPKICLKPETGLSFLNSGFTASGVMRKRTCATLATTPATQQAKAIGATDSPISLATLRMTAPIVARCTTSGASAPSRSMSCMASWQWATMLGPVAASVKSPASSTTAPLRSADFATWPFLRASSTFLGVAFSVLSEPDIGATRP